MYSYLKGIITEIDVNYVVLDVNGVGYKIYVANPFSYQENNEYKIYVYNKISEDDYSLFGFKEKDEYELFLKLISVKGLGPRLALPILATGSLAGIKDAIDRENLARQIILDLKGKINIDIDESISDDNIDDLISVLESLGYKIGEIKKIIASVDTTKSLEEQVKEALKLLMR